MDHLQPEQLDTFRQKGFLLVKNFIPKSIIANIKAEAEGVHERCAKGEISDGIAWEDLPEGEAPKVRQLMGSQNVCPSIREVLMNPSLSRIICQLLDEEHITFFHSKLMMKAAQKGSFTPWHSDWSYWKHIFTVPKQMNCFLAIDESTLENGCIRYVPNSHHAYIEHEVFKDAKGFNLGLPGDINAYPEAEPVEMEPGDA